MSRYVHIVEVSHDTKILIYKNKDKKTPKTLRKILVGLVLKNEKLQKINKNEKKKLEILDYQIVWRHSL